MFEFISFSTLTNIQVTSGVAFSSYLVLHLGNTFLAPLGPEGFNEAQKYLRNYYQTPVIEATVVFGAIAAHSAASVIKIIKRKKLVPPGALSQKLHRFSGFYLLAAIIPHTFGTRFASFWFGEEYAVDFAGLLATLKLAGIFFYPYYILLSMSGIYHLNYGITYSLKHMGFKKVHWSTPAFVSTIALGSLWCIYSVLSFDRFGISMKTIFEHWEKTREVLPAALVLPAAKEFSQWQN